MKAWRGPAYPGEFPTLGYEVLEWLHAYLPSPADDTQPFTPTDEQYRLVLHWYRLDPTSGRFTERRGAVEQAKGWGKSPLVAALAICDFAGPARFDGWDASGDPVAKPWGRGDDPPPKVVIAANSEDQADNTYGAVYGYLSARQGKVADELGIDVGRRVGLYLKDNPKATFQPVTASAGTREGDRTTLGVMDETMLWTRQSRGMQLANVIRRNVAKMDGRTIETCNAPLLGQHSVAEATIKAAESGEPGVYHYATRPTETPQPDWSDEQMLAQLRRVYGDSSWVDLPRLVKEIRDSSTDWPDALRFYFNTPSAGAGIAVDPREWDKLAKPREVEPGTVIGLGFDGSFSGDATVLMACTADGYSWPLGWWENTQRAEDWRVPRLAVADAVDAAFATYRVGRMYCDPWKWQTEIAGWAEKYGEDIVLELDTSQTKRHATALDRWRVAIAEKSHTHDGDPRLRAHVVAAHLIKPRINQTEDGRTLYVLAKGDDGRRIDGAVADVLALEAAMTMPEPEIPPQVEFY